MPIQVDAYVIEGMASGVLARPGHLRDVLEETRELPLVQVRWQPLVGDDSPSGDVTIPIDDILIAVADDDPTIPVHAAWHAIRLELGPYIVEGDMPTLPGFDPGRALTRPSGEFVLLRDVRVGLRDDPSSAEPIPIGHHALINRYVVERVEADLMLGFFFPGASMPDPEPPTTDDAAAPTSLAAGPAETS
ncbi:MAG: hypothetical protein ACTS8Z_03080 [Candidatus Limnocylindrales bacterium]